MAEINVYWLSYHKDALARGYWDQGILEEMFDKGDFKHHTGLDVEPGNDGGVVVINGRTHVEYVDKINNDLAKLGWVVMIITGDEEALFPWQEIRHPMLRTWVQLPRMNQHNDVSQKLINGYRPHTKQIIGEIGAQKRIFDWMFIGQVTHPRREQCVEAARDLPNGLLMETHSFGEEIEPYGNYLARMAQTKIALCPSGPESPDTFRLYEALESGCLPVVDAFASNNQDWGFWQYLFGDDIPFPIVDYWDKLPELLPELLKDYPRNANRCFAWWQQQKRKLHNKLIDDIKVLHG